MRTKLALAAALLAALTVLAGIYPPSGDALAQAGYVNYGPVTAGNPTYTAGTNQPISLDTQGGLRVVCIENSCSGGAGGGGGGFVTTNAPSYTAGTNQALSLDIQGGLRTLDESDGPVTPGVAAGRSVLFGGQFNTSLPSLTNGQQAAAQFDSSGRLIVNVGAGGGTGGTSSNFGAAFPGIGTPIGFSQGGNFIAATGTAGNLNVSCQSGCSASSDTSNGAVVPGVAATTSKLGGVQFNTVAPTLTNAQQAAMQGDSHANLLVNLNTPLPAGANVIGQVGGTTVGVSVTPTVTVAAYSAGQCVGGLLTIAGAARSGGPGSALLQSATVTDASGQDSAIDIVVFRANPTGSTFTDHATCTVATADLPKIVGTLPVSDCHLLGASAPGMCQAQQQAIPVDLGNGNTTAWAVMIARGTPTYSGTSNISARFGFLQD